MANILPLPSIVIKGAGEMATGVALRLHRAGFRRLLLLEIPRPSAVRRAVSFCEAVYDGRSEVEGIAARRFDPPEEKRGDGEIIRCLTEIWKGGSVAVAVDPHWRLIAEVRPGVVVDATIAKRNLGTTRREAELVVALGPGFTAGVDAHCVIETNRGHNLGRVLTAGGAEADTGIPGDIGGFTLQRVLRAPADGRVDAALAIGSRVEKGEQVCTVAGVPVRAEISGVLRGCIRPGIEVKAGLKIGDVDPRGRRDYCFSVSEKARALGGAVLEAVCAYWLATQAPRKS